MIIQDCKIENINICATLLIQVYSEPEYGESWKESDAIDYLTRFYEIDPTGCSIAVIDKEIVGAIFSYSYPWQSETLRYVQELFVSTKYRKKGIAKSLLKSVTKDKNSKVWLLANDNTSAASFYKKMGFKKDSPYKINYGTLNT